MKRFIAAVTAACTVLLCQAPFVSAKKEYTAPEYSGAKSEYVTREQAAACFIRAVGRENFKYDIDVLDGFFDKNEVSYSYREEMSAAILCGLIGGYEDNTLRPQAYITRIEALVMLNRALGNVKLSEWSYVNFDDVPKWASEHVNRLAAAGIVKGYDDGRVGAADLLTPSQINTLCERIVRYTGPCGDFYNYVNAAWLENTDIEGILYTSDAKRIHDTLANQVEDIIYRLYRKHYNDGQQYSDESCEFRIITAYSAAADQVYRDKIGFKPLTEALDIIDNIKDKDSLTAAMSYLTECGFETLMPLKADADLFKDSEYTLSISGFYKGVFSDTKDFNEGEKFKDAYTDYISTLFALWENEKPIDSVETKAQASKADETEIRRQAQLAYEVCRAIAADVEGDKADSENRENNIKKEDNIKNAAAQNGISDIKKRMAADAVGSGIKSVNRDSLKQMYAGVDTDKLLDSIGGDKLASVMIYNQAETAAAGKLCSADSDKSESVKAYLKAAVLDSMAMYLTTDAFNACKKYKSALAGIPVSSDDSIPADYAVEITKKLVGWELSKLYVDMYFPESCKDLTETIAREITDEYKKLISGCSSLTPEARTTEIRKLQTLKIKVAFPDDFDEYIKNGYPMIPTSQGGSLPQYIIEKAKAETAGFKVLLQSNANADKDEWIIYPYTANAVYDPTSNSITIPAGILQAPFFEYGATEEENLGGIGFVIAHEISHAFDLKGCQFDEKGVLKGFNRWSDNDYNAFYALCEVIENEYASIRVNGQNIDGKATLNENFADIAGISCVISMAKSKKLDLDKIFASYAKCWRTKAKDDYTDFILKNDSHSPSSVRVNRVLSNFDEFADCYGVIEGDGMFIPKERKINIFK